ncbi:cell envelope integrity protein TolA [Sulfitobacter dubius]|uniref:cell envelope integrity protein TolA n=1 Tax=Sulfitobacter dubius TaxID=218673 RepID=UPI0022AEC088|nr:TonB family protein [Sulfitobacter dubius]MCZ4366189.1 TonB family protein [Sulfitobacter dubius]
MIPRSSLAKTLSIGVAASLVVGVSQLTQIDDSVKIAGGGAPAAAQLGTRFEDMAVGTLEAEPVEEIMPTPEPEPLKTAQALPPTPAPEPTLTPTPSPVAEPVQAVKAEPMPAAPPPTTAAQTPVLPALTPVETPPETIIATPTITAAAPAPPVETLTAEAEDDAPRLSQRPQRRDPERAAEAAKKAKPKPQPKTKPKQTTRGNAKRDNTKGAQTAARAGNAAQSGTRQRAAAPAGNAAASNYPGQVMSRIARVGKPRVRSRGTAVIAFSIGNGGQLAGVRVARSSGSAALDQAALGIIRQAAPFPRPPAGAQRNFSIQIKGR